jgi:AcrR family transcriptional regulator
VSPAGRRPGKADTRQVILQAARDCFAQSGYGGASVRAIAAKAGVDPALVHHFFGAKAALFAAAMDFPIVPGAVLPTLLEGNADDAGERILRMFLALWDDPDSRRRMLAIVRSAVQYEAAATMLRTFLRREVIGAFVRNLDSPDADLRATFVGSQLIGLALARYVIKLPPLAAASTETVVAAYAPTIQRYLTGNVTGS